MAQTCRRTWAHFAVGRVSVILAIAFLFSSAAAFAQAAKIPPAKRAQLEAAISRFMAANSTPGVSVAVVENGVEEWSAGFGSADLENAVPATSHTLYRLASVSKPITAIAALLLWQQGNWILTLRCRSTVRRFREGYTHHDPRTARASGRNSPLQVGFTGRP